MNVALQLIVLAIQEGPEALALVLKIIEAVHKNFAKPEDTLAELQRVLEGLVPMQKKV